MPIKKEVDVYQEAIEQQRSQAWLISFADLLSLILTFFVLLYSMSTLQEVHWETLVNALSERLRVNESAKTARPSADENVLRIELSEAKDLDYLAAVLQNALKNETQQADVFTIQKLEDRLILSLVSDLCFDPSSAKLKEKAHSAVSTAAEILQTLDNQVEVYGNASNIITATAAYPSDWELSLARAWSVASLLEERGYSYTVPAYGRAKASFATLPYNLSSEQREKATQRIDIVIRQNDAR